MSMIDTIMPDRFAVEAFEAAQGDVKAAVNRLQARLGWTREEAEQELRICLAAKGASRGPSRKAEHRGASNGRTRPRHHHGD